MNNHIWRHIPIGVFFIPAIILAACAPSVLKPTQMPVATVPAPSKTPVILPPTSTLEPTATRRPATNTSSDAAKMPAATESTPTTATAPAPSATPESYTVQPGDTLISIAIQQDVNYEDFLAVNNIADPDNYVILPGDILLLPPSDYSDAPSGGAMAYRVKEGETFSSIAAKFGVSVDSLRSANPEITPETLSMGTELLIPWSDIHIVAPGDTLSSIALRYGVSIEDIIAANEETYPELRLSPILQLGWKLVIPRQNEEAGSQPGVAADCSPQPPRTAVISYTVQAGEGMICLALKFGVSEPTILYANPDIWDQGGLSPGAEILIPPADGALYVLTEEDAANDATLEDIARWYGVWDLNAITDWQGQPVSLPLKEGQQLYIPGSDALAGDFNVIMAKNLNPPAAPPALDPTRDK